MAVIPFYGAEDPTMFALERRAMDRPGRVLQALDRRLPESGVVLDVGAGDGFTAQKLASPGRSVVALEPAAGMIRPGRKLNWVRGEAEHLPMAAGSVDAAYATWAYFFTGLGWDPSPGIVELHRVVRSGGAILVVDNLGNDEFTDYVDEGEGHQADVARWRRFGFEVEEVETAFVFDNFDEAAALLGFFFGEPGRTKPKLQIAFRVGLFHATSRGPTN